MELFFEEGETFTCPICGLPVVWIDFKTVGNGPKGQLIHRTNPIYPLGKIEDKR